MESNSRTLDISQTPWKVKIEDCGGIRTFDVESYDGSVIASFDCCPEQWSNEEGHANAHLIAAAPEMYKTLCELADSLSFLNCGYRDESGKVHDSVAMLQNAKKVLDRASGISPKPLACPFCGSEELEVVVKHSGDAFVQCQKCSYQSPFAISEEVDVEEHNRVSKIVQNERRR